MTFDQPRTAQGRVGRLHPDALERENHENAVIPHDLAAVSVGLIDGEVFLDLDYILDSNADVDMNVIKTNDGKYVKSKELEKNPPSPPTN